MALEKVAVDFIREKRAAMSDAKIRAALAAQGFSAELLEEAFAAAGPRPAAKRRLWVWAAGGLAFVVAASLVLLNMIGSWVRRQGTGSPRPEVASYAPQPYADPANLGPFLPPGVATDGDAAADYRALAATKGGVLDGGPGDFRAPTEEQARLLATALTKRRSTLGFALARPGLKAYSTTLALKIKLLTAIGVHLQKGVTAARDKGDWEGVDRGGRALVLLGWHFSQDWDGPVQNAALFFLAEGIKAQVAAADRLGKADDAYGVLVGRMMRDLKAYAAAEDALTAARPIASDPARLKELQPNLDEPERRRPYAATTLLLAAGLWSDAEAAEGRPDERRSAFLREASAHEDQGVRTLAKDDLAIAKDLEDLLKTVPRAKRAEVLSGVDWSSPD